ncbi:tropomyosin-1, isoforms 33/34-like [Hyposmocoma kahamanoa]|uniref:tropomyosin-1, isoforms 33/34-like n=1 Tax=Hyposmocoma kahamanoa TaxID=1477025 RepID=UPI000E6D826B|nr:tropomyosin-1, isoforms 33/34-like [Hyposmocoma kahamanoa]
MAGGYPVVRALQWGAHPPFKAKIDMEKASFENSPQAGPRKGESRPPATAGGSPSYSGGGKNCLVSRPEADSREHNMRTRSMDSDLASNRALRNNGSKASNMEVMILSDCESEGERMVSASSDVESTLSEGNSRAVSRSGSAREEESSRAPKRAAPPSNECMEPERAPKINTARRGRTRGPGKPFPGAATAGRGRSSSSEWNALQKEADAAFFKEALGLDQAGEAEPDGTAGLMRETLAQEARDGLAAILAETAKSSNLKGTVVKAIKEAVRKVEGAVDFLHRGETATEAARRMSEDNRRMRGQLAALETEMKALRGAYSSAMAKAKAQVAPPPCSSAEMHAGVREAIDDLRRDIFSSMRNMMDARLGDIERRLPAEYLRPPLGGRTGAPAPEATPAAIAVAAAAPKLLPSAEASKLTPGPSLARNAPAGQRPNKKAKRKTPPPKATPPAAPPAVLAVPTALDPAASTPTDQAETPWSQVVGRKARKAKTAAAAPQAARAPAKAALKTAPRPRALATPKSSAVVITLRPEAVAEKGATYKGVLEAATAAVDLGSLGIPHVRVRNTQTGARIVEVPGATSAEKADTLAAKLEEVIGGLATVTRPTKTADLRATGFDESVTPEKIQAVVAAKGQCPQSAVSVGAVRLAPNGRGSAIVRCPVTAAQRVAAAGRMLVGWSSAVVHVMEPLPMRCFRCMGIGHTRALCPSSVDRSGVCFRCGQVGHSASGCTATPRCSVCTATRRPADHIMGGRSCAPPPTKGKPAGTSGPPPY